MRLEIAPESHLYGLNGSTGVWMVVIRLSNFLNDDYNLLRLMSWPRGGILARGAEVKPREKNTLIGMMMMMTMMKMMLMMMIYNASNAMYRGLRFI